MEKYWLRLNFYWINSIFHVCDEQIKNITIVMCWKVYKLTQLKIIIVSLNCFDTGHVLKIHDTVYVTKVEITRQVKIHCAIVC